MKCVVCSARYDSPRKHSVYCSPACRQRAYRDRERAKKKAKTDFDSKPYVSSNITDAHDEHTKGWGTDSPRLPRR